MSKQDLKRKNLQVKIRTATEQYINDLLKAENLSGNQTIYRKLYKVKRI